MDILNKQSLLRSDYSCGIKPGAGTFLRKNRHTVILKQQFTKPAQVTRTVYPAPNSNLKLMK